MAHSHGVRSSDSVESDRRLILAIAINLALTIAQVIGGIVAGSLALVADALHNLNDAASLGIALLARRIGRKPADKRRTFGYKRAELIGALVNLTALIIVGLYLIYEAIRRLFEPEPVGGWIVVWIASVALIVDAATALLTWSISEGSLNVKAAFIHNLADALASVAVIIAGSLIILFQWSWADLVATLLISSYILWQGVTMMRSTIRMLMDSVPEDMDLDEVVAVIEAVDGVNQAHHLHVWWLDEQTRSLEAHIVINDSDASRMEAIKRAIKEALKRRFDIEHSTLEMELAGQVGHGDHDRSVVPRH